MAMVAVAAKATLDGGGVAGWRGGGVAGWRRRPQRQSSQSAAVVVRGYRRPSQHRHRQKLEQYQIPARTMTVEAAAEVAAEAAEEAAVVARRIATPPPPTGGGLRFYRIAPTLAVECSTSYTAAASVAAVLTASAHILLTIGRTTMRAAGGGAPATTAATVMTWPGITAAT